MAEALINYSIYTTATGSITRTGVVSDLDNYNAQSVDVTETIIDIQANSTDHYFVAGVRTDRPLLSSIATWNKIAITADGIDEAVLSGLPNPTTVSMIPEGRSSFAPQTVVVTDGTLEVTSNNPAVFNIEIDLFPYKLYTAQVTAT